MYRIYNFFHQMISLDSIILQQEYHILYVQIIWHCAYKGTNCTLCKWNNGLVLFAYKTFRPYLNIFFLFLCIFLRFSLFGAGHLLYIFFSYSVFGSRFPSYFLFALFFFWGVFSYYFFGSGLSSYLFFFIFSFCFRIFLIFLFS